MDHSENQNDANNIERVIPLGEETLNVDKRRVEGRTTTIRRIVLQRPATADVELESETVVVETRDPVDLNAIGEVLEESVYEARDFTEEPAVSKETRVVQEVVVRRIRSVRHETINETVRYDEAQVERSDDDREQPADNYQQMAARG